MPSDRNSFTIQKLTSSSYGPSQADVASFKALPGPPKVEMYPHAWLVVRLSLLSVITCVGAGTNTYHPTNQVHSMKNITFGDWRSRKDTEFTSLPGDPSKAYTTYGPEKSELTINPKDAPKAAEAEKEEEDDDLFGSDDESEDEEAKKKREENLAAYKKKKEGKTKPAAKTIVTLDVKPWGIYTLSITLIQHSQKYIDSLCLQMTRPT